MSSSDSHVVMLYPFEGFFFENRTDRDTKPLAWLASSVFRRSSQSASSRWASLTICRVTRVIIGAPSGARRLGSALQPDLLEAGDGVLGVNEAPDFRVQPLEVGAVVPRDVHGILVHQVRDLPEDAATVGLGARRALGHDQLVHLRVAVRMVLGVGAGGVEEDPEVLVGIRTIP